MIKPLKPRGPFTVIDGHGVDPQGILFDAWAMERGAPRHYDRLHCLNHRANNGQFMAWSDGEALPVNPPIRISDCIFEHASASPPGSANGTAEANLWVGLSAHVNRVVLRDGAWMGLWTGGSCHGSTFQNLRISEQRIGIYMEHDTTKCRFRDLLISADTGITVEWSYGGHGSHSNVIEDFDITCTDPQGYGIFLDGGPYGFTIRNGVIRGGAGISVPRLDPRYMVDPFKPNVIENVTRPDGSPVPVTYHERPWERG